MIQQLPLVAEDRANANIAMDLGKLSEVVTGSGKSVISRAGTALDGKA